jgi:hypothetical protein
VGQIIHHEGKDVVELPEVVPLGVQTVLAKAVKEQKLVRSATSRVGIRESGQEVVRRKRNAELITDILDEIFPMEDGKWGNLVDQLSGVYRSEGRIYYEPLAHESEA